MSKEHYVEGMIIYRVLRGIKKLTILLFVLAFILSSSILLLILYLQAQPLPNTTISQTSFIYSSTGEVIDDLHAGERREYVALNKVSESLVNATIAIEDRKFYQHMGIDLVRIGGAAIQNIKYQAKVQGASTITQQLARNLYLSLEKTWERKIKEALLALQLELQYSKDDILEMYLNQTYYGHGAYGVQLAAKTFYDKESSELSLAEASMLAGVPKGPTYYSPLVDFEKAKSRQWQVLLAMIEEGFITETEAKTAYEQELVFKSRDESIYTANAPYFRDYITSQLRSVYGLNEEQIYQGGLKIYTTLDLEIQKAAEEMIDKLLPEDRPLQTALVSIEPNTGFIKAMVGGRDYSESQFNRVINAKRQPGSSFKPIIYLAALEKGLDPLTLFKSEPTVFVFGNQTWNPANYADRYANKEIDMRYALTHSDNIYATHLIQEITPELGVEMAKKLGIKSELQPYPSLALGTMEVSPLEMTVAYTTIASGGKRVEPSAVLKIEDSFGNVLFEKKEIEQVEEVSNAASFVLTHLMEGVFEPGGTGQSVANILKRPVAGKTGTTDTDSWLIGFTPQLVTTVWNGYDQGTYISDLDALITKEIWAQYMEKAHKGLAPQLFAVPETGVTSAYVCPDTHLLATVSCPSPRLEAFIEGTEPAEYCTDHIPTEEELLDQPNNLNNNPSLWIRFKNWWN